MTHFILFMFHRLEGYFQSEDRFLWIICGHKCFDHWSLSVSRLFNDSFSSWVITSILNFSEFLSWYIILSFFKLGITSLPIQRYCPTSPCNTVETCPTQPYNIWAFRNSQQTSSTPGALPSRSCLPASVTSPPVMDDSPPPFAASSTDVVSVGLRRSWKYSFHRPTISSAEVSSALQCG